MGHDIARPKVNTFLSSAAQEFDFNNAERSMLEPTRIGVVLGIEAPRLGPRGEFSLRDNWGTRDRLWLPGAVPKWWRGAFFLFDPAITSSVEGDAAHGFSAWGPA
jgi:hypothetical protein